MGFMRPPSPPQTSPEVLAAQQRAEERAVASERDESARAASRMRLMQTGGLRLLFSPTRQQGQARNTLGSSGGMTQ